MERAWFDSFEGGAAEGFLSFSDSGFEDLLTTFLEATGHEEGVLLLGELFVAGEPGVFQGELLEKVFLVDLLSPPFCFVVGGRVHYLKGPLYPPHGVVEAVVAGVVGDFFNKAVLDGLEDGVKEVVLDIGGVGEELVRVSSVPDATA